MPEEQKTQYGTPIPLRDNMIRSQPNPWTRLEAAQVPRERLRALMKLVDDRGSAPDGNGIVGVLIVIAEQLDTALAGNLDAVEDVRDGTAELEDWLTVVAQVLYPASERRHRR